MVTKANRLQYINNSDLIIFFQKNYVVALMIVKYAVMDAGVHRVYSALILKKLMAKIVS